MGAKKAKKPKAKKKKKKKKKAAKKKNSGKGIFKKCACSADLAAITGQKSMTRGQAVKAVWVYIKKKGLNNGRNVKAVGKIFGGGNMLKLAGAIQKHLK